MTTFGSGYPNVVVVLIRPCLVLCPSLILVLSRPCLVLVLSDPCLHVGVVLSWRVDLVVSSLVLSCLVLSCVVLRFIGFYFSRLANNHGHCG